MRVLLLLLFSFSCFINCGSYTTQNNNGGASETVNASVNIGDSMVTVNLRAKDTVNAMISLLGTDYNPVINSGFCKTVGITAKDSSVAFTNLNGSSYNLIITENIRGKSLSIMDFEIGKGERYIISDTLSLSGTIQGKVSSSATQWSGNSELSYAVLILGTPFFIELNRNGDYRFMDVPKGVYSVVGMLMTRQKDDVNSTRMVKRVIQINSGEVVEGINLFFSN